MARFWKNRLARGIFLQAVYAAVILTIIGVCVVIGGSRMGQLGATGYGFLFQSTGWGIPFSVIKFDSFDPYWRVLLSGILNTLFLATVALSIASVLGVIIGVARTSPNHLAKLVGVIYVELFRNIPLILQVFFWYEVILHLPTTRHAITFANSVLFTNRGVFLPGLNVTRPAAVLAIAVFVATIGLVVWVRASRRFRRMEPGNMVRLRLLMLGVGIVAVVAVLWLGRVPGTPLVGMPVVKGLGISGGLHVPTALLTMVISMALFGGAYVGEIVRGGFEAVGKGQIEAAHSLGLNSWQSLTRVRLPLAIRAMLPTLINQYVWLIKATTLGIAIGYADFFMIVSTAINQSGRTIELVGILIAGFLIINFTFARILNRVNRAIALKGSSGGG